MPSKAPAEPPVILKGPLGFVANRLGIQPWGQILLVVLAFATFALWRRLDAIDRHLTKNDGQIERLPLEMSKELLSQAETDLKIGRVSKALRVIDSANAFLAKASVKKIPASLDYFEDARTSLNSIASIASGYSDSRLTESSHTSLLLLAAYRSALERPPANRADEKSVTHSVGQYAYTKGELSGELKRVVINIHLQDNTEDFLVPPSRSFSSNFTIRGPVFNANGASQTLDGVHWVDVVFVGAHIKYLGGDLDLQNVRFVNCTFDVPANPNGGRLLDYAILVQNKLNIAT